MKGGTLAEALATPLASLRERQLAPVDVAVLDSGVDATHERLVGRVAASYESVMEDGRAVWRDIEGPVNNDVFGHGTAVAGIIAGIAPNARIVDVRVLGRDNQGKGDCTILALEQAVQRRWGVLNMSLAMLRRYSTQARPLCETAWRQGQVVVSAKRNFVTDDMGLPAEFTSSISVDCGTFTDPLSFVFQPGEVIEFVALGENVTVAHPGNSYRTMTGTSFATPAMSAVCALLLGAFPDLRPFEVRSVLRRHALERAAAAATGGSAAPGARA